MANPYGPIPSRPRRPVLRQIPLDGDILAPGRVTLTMSIGQWDTFLAVGYDMGCTLLELDDLERPVAAYRRGEPS